MPSREEVERAAAEGHKAIDKTYDLFDRVLEGAGRLFGIDVNAPDASRPVIGHVSPANGPRELGRGPQGAANGPILGQKMLGSPTIAARFRIEEVTDAITGVDSWIVTDGTNKAECSTRAMAEQVLGALRGTTP